MLLVEIIETMENIQTIVSYSQNRFCFSLVIQAYTLVLYGWSEYERFPKTCLV